MIISSILTIEKKAKAKFAPGELCGSYSESATIVAKSPNSIGAPAPVSIRGQYTSEILFTPAIPSIDCILGDEQCTDTEGLKKDSLEVNLTYASSFNRTKNIVRVRKTPYDYTERFRISSGAFENLISCALINGENIECKQQNEPVSVYTISLAEEDSFIFNRLSILHYYEISLRILDINKGKSATFTLNYSIDSVKMKNKSLLDYGFVAKSIVPFPYEDFGATPQGCFINNGTDEDIDDCSGALISHQSLSKRPASQMQMSRDGWDALLELEGFRPTPYNDTKNYCTVGVGKLLFLRPCRTTDDPVSTKYWSELQKNSPEEYEAFMSSQAYKNEVFYQENPLSIEQAISDKKSFYISRIKPKLDQINTPLLQSQYDAVVMAAYNAEEFLGKDWNFAKSLRSGDLKKALSSLWTADEGGEQNIRRRSIERGYFARFCTDRKAKYKEEASKHVSSKYSKIIDMETHRKDIEFFKKKFNLKQ